MLKSKLLSALVILIAFLLVSFSTVRYTDSDSRGSLLVSESIIKYQTIKLDHYGKDVLSSYEARINQKNGHFYYYFPIGTSIVSIPFVAIAEVMGLNMTQSEPEVQIAIASLTAILIIIFLIKLARIFLSPSNAVLISAVFWFGTSFASTSGTALWSHNFASLFSLISIYYVIRSTIGP